MNFYKERGIGIISGIITHLLLDIITVQGICLFSPFWNEKISFGNIRTGSKAERRINFLLIVLIITAVMVVFYYSDIKSRG